MKKSKYRPKCKILYWHQIDWKQAEKTVYSLQRRIYQASSRDDVKVVRRLQKLLLGSFQGNPIRKKKDKQSSLGIIRYADDFVIIHKDVEIIKEAKEKTQEWLKQVGLEIKPEKTRLCH